MESNCINVTPLALRYFSGGLRTARCVLYKHLENMIRFIFILLYRGWKFIVSLFKYIIEPTLFALWLVTDEKFSVLRRFLWFLRDVNSEAAEYVKSMLKYFIIDDFWDTRIRRATDLFQNTRYMYIEINIFFHCPFFFFFKIYPFYSFKGLIRNKHRQNLYAFILYKLNYDTWDTESEFIKYFTTLT